MSRSPPPTEAASAAAAAAAAADAGAVAVDANAAAPVGRRPRSKLLTTEPALFAYMGASALNDTLSQQMLFEKYCALHYGPSEAPSVCSNATLTDADDALQADTSRMNFYCSAVAVLPSIVACLYLGAVGDRRGHKYPTVVPLLGATVAYALFALQCHFAFLDPRYSLLSSFALGASGYFTAAQQTCYSYLTAAIPPEARTLRIAVAEVTVLVATMGGSFGVGPLVSAVGLTTAYALMSAANLLCALYCLIWLDGPAQRSWPSDTISGNSRGNLNVIESLRDSVRFVVKKRPGHTSAYIRAALVAFLLCFCATDGAADVLYLFLTKVHGFSTSLYGYYSGADFGCKLLLSSVALAVARRWFGADDLSLAIVGFMSGAMGYAVIGALSSDWLWMIWCSPAIGSLHLLYSVGSRSFLSKSVGDDEQARLFALVSGSQSLTDFVASLIFNNLYPATLTFYPGLSFAVASLLCIIAMATVAYVKHNKHRALATGSGGGMGGKYDVDEKQLECDPVEDDDDDDSKTLTVNGEPEASRGHGHKAATDWWRQVRMWTWYGCTKALRSFFTRRTASQSRVV